MVLGHVEGCPRHDATVIVCLFRSYISCATVITTLNVAVVELLQVADSN